MRFRDVTARRIKRVPRRCRSSHHPLRYAKNGIARRGAILPAEARGSGRLQGDGVEFLRVDAELADRVGRLVRGDGPAAGEFDDRRRGDVRRIDLE